MRHLWVVVFGLHVACISDQLVVCGDLACPAGSICTTTGCASPDQVTACVDLGEAESCATAAFSGVCLEGTCQPVICGDGRMIGPEVCDDANQRSGDGCSADCLSTEVCGNAYVDTLAAEQCDDLLPGLSRDGCTGRCTVEIDEWRDVSPAPPRGRISSAVAFDARRGRTVVFGGLANGEVLNDTWEWDGTTWRSLAPAISPAPRLRHAMAYDPDRQRVVLYGGDNGSISALADMWEWDGVTWIEISSRATPGEREEHSLAYDPVRRELVLFGGNVGDTWTWDGTTWTQHTSPPTPPATAKPMAWDPTSSTLVLFAGSTGQTWSWDGTAWSSVATTGPPTRGGHVLASSATDVVLYGGHQMSPLSDTWRWANGSWTLLAPSSSPGPLTYAHACFDASRNRVVVFGGTTTVFNSVGLNGIYEWNGSNWAQATPVTAPSIRDNFAVAYQPLTGRTLLFGGFFNHNDTWEWDGVAWVRRQPATSPLPREAHAMAATRNTVVMFGGMGSSDGETWVWNGSTWTAHTQATPSRRLSASMTYDARRDRVVMFGGQDNTGVVPPQTWEWDGATWSERPTAHAPPSRFFASMSYDSIRGESVLFGGSNPSGFLGDTWLYDGVDWREVTPALSPPARIQAASAFDIARGAVLLFGGIGAETYDDTWAWDGARWTTLVPTTFPTRRRLHAMAYDAARGNTVMFGGRNSAFATRNDTWILELRSQSYPADHCIDVDTDDDGLVGCADPDCWGRCTPLCPPRLPCVTPTVGCGDGTCSSLEDAYLCPSDCS